MRYKQQHKDGCTCEDFKNRLVKEFEPVDYQNNLKIQLPDLRQTDSLERYILRYKAIVNQIRDISESDQLFFFRIGLKLNLELNKECDTRECNCLRHKRNSNATQINADRTDRKK